MGNTSGNKKKIINDPVHGFISISHNILFDIIEHSYFQRLRRIKQLGLTDIVYPGAIHTRFQHALGTMFLMDEALKNLKLKKQNINNDEVKAAKAAILMHDIGHGPFSHALEHLIVNDISHEEISLLMMKKLNEQFFGKLKIAIDIFQGNYPKKYLSQLISSQLDVDRMDYLRRDSFYTGVSEGVIGSGRILNMLNVKDDSLVVEHKGIYSIDNFLNARRIMYWQVYLHKAVLSAEFMLINILKRAKVLAAQNVELFSTPALAFFLYNNIQKVDFLKSDEPLENFSLLDDFDILSSIKVWTKHKDLILSDLCSRLINRNLLKISLKDDAFTKEELGNLIRTLKLKLPFAAEHPEYYVFTGTSENHFYDYSKDNINILMKDGSVKDISLVSDQWNSSLSNFASKKFFLCYPKF